MRYLSKINRLCQLCDPDLHSQNTNLVRDEDSDAPRRLVVADVPENLVLELMFRREWVRALPPFQ